MSVFDTGRWLSMRALPPAALEAAHGRAGVEREARQAQQHLPGVGRLLGGEESGRIADHALLGLCGRSGRSALRRDVRRHGRLRRGGDGRLGQQVNDQHEQRSPSSGRK
ncbi:hypothetical protein [Phenylobacterium sp. J367]|uniref:hypothetical protein n=1 Tax=Phenylobacterium sp. J367 TaxID=2898435 RepID=UPI0021507C4A|nr:hypothetical protein [Phenylobacterium sp. J367]MCR5877464.1 hypothetical protein [Phenylobacterium sp. J367]